MPISHPSYYAGYLAKRHGPFATLGLAEDTWALNEGVTDDATFLQQAHDIDDERRSMCVTAIDQLRRGALVCVFDATDRIQHMFWRYLDAAHPAHRADVPDPHKHAIRDLYEKNDRLVGDVLGRLQPNDVLMVLSDHGFSAFRRGVNLNAWLLREGYLALRPGHDGKAEWLRDVDWSRTRAYCVGLGGMYLNLRGREQDGIVAPGAEAAALKAEIVGKLNGLRDADRDEIGVREAFDTAALYSGPYLENAPTWSSATTPATGRRGTARPAWSPARSSRTTPRRGAATTASTRDWCRACSSATARSPPRAISRSSTSRRPRSRSSGSSRRPTWRAGPGPWRHDRAGPPAPGRAGGARRAGRRVRAPAYAGRPPRDRPRHRRPRLPPGARSDRPGPAAEPGPARRGRPLHAAGHHDPAAQPGGVVHVHHRPRSRGARHLRLHPSPSRDDRVVPVDLAHRAARAHADARPLAVPAGRRPRRAAAPRARRSGRCSKPAVSRPPSSACRPTFRPRAPRPAS